MTQYVVLRQQEITVAPTIGEPEPNELETLLALTIVGTFEANSDDGACRAGAKKIYAAEKKAGRITLVATPARSFAPAEFVIEEEPNVSKSASVSVAGLT